jgi:copper chaperone NosL
MRALVRVAAALLTVVLATTIGGCGDESNSGPPDIEYGRDVCAECHMIISEARYAAAYREEGREAYAFDDIVDMVTHGTRARVLADVDAWVHDFLSEDWIEARTAWYVDADITTPMGGGVVAFEAEVDAQAFAEERGGQVLRWQELVAGVETEMSGATGTTGGTEP